MQRGLTYLATIFSPPGSAAEGGLFNDFVRLFISTFTEPILIKVAWFVELWL